MRSDSQSNSGQTIIPLEYQGVFAEPWSLGKLVRLLATIGPAAIVASVAIGAGETIVVVRAGAWAGYGLLWEFTRESSSIFRPPSGPNINGRQSACKKSCRSM